ncbi:Trans-aconitate methyltransferase [Gordonia bronchialis]|nr:class I SAM-dependent methyltransferase [Gordonia bronchialis]MCC3324219.1 class I SAM-dependent methyltransferase [Gordonia bronchialis]QGS24903.1 methyltransferase domain-containing protein [Gordonia bronchialis]UAK38838.1 class I SAM-dependent methyltransferase [Gordonia bronchialis]STQ64317.1 Trans-aconitate methyltransferase [Gordonia bronchialis]
MTAQHRTIAADSIADSEEPEQTRTSEDALMSFVFRAVDEVGATLNTALVVLGDKLGYYRAMTGGPVTAAQLAESTATGLPYAREWLNAQAAGGFVDYAPATGRYTLPPEHAVALTDESSPAFVGGLYQIALGTVADSARVVEAVRNRGGLGWHERNADVHLGCERFFTPSYAAHLVGEWLPAAGVADAMTAGIRVVDIGCGHGSSTILMAGGHPASTFIGVDSHPESIALARRRAIDAGVADRVDFEIASASEDSTHRCELVTTFDALHDMGDPDGAAARVHEMLVAGGHWMIVEPMAGDRVEDNLTPVGRAYYGFSTLLCTPASLSQPVGTAIGTQAGPARIAEIVTGAGFASCRTVAQTPFHRVLVAERG